MWKPYIALAWELETWWWKWEQEVSCKGNSSFLKVKIAWWWLTRRWKDHALNPHAADLQFQAPLLIELNIFWVCKLYYCNALWRDQSKLKFSFVRKSLRRLMLGICSILSLCDKKLLASFDKGEHNILLALSSLHLVSDMCHISPWFLSLETLRY